MSMGRPSTCRAESMLSLGDAMIVYGAYRYATDSSIPLPRIDKSNL